ncbi:MAG TPA: hypothetical protein RMH99_19960 [Sandaracinaceae bacterium LLY-WYZ-13_1]|nr:hypothetical protein [Sandaracinaceae bacterium LLY-WYZ-13_1]
MPSTTPGQPSPVGGVPVASASGPGLGPDRPAWVGRDASSRRHADGPPVRAEPMPRDGGTPPGGSVSASSPRPDAGARVRTELLWSEAPPTRGATATPTPYPRPSGPVDATGHAPSAPEARAFEPRARAAPSRGPSPWAYLGLALLAVLLAGGLGVLGVLVFRLIDRADDGPTSPSPGVGSSAGPAAPSPGVGSVTGSSPTAGAPAPTAADPVIPPAAPDEPPTSEGATGAPPAGPTGGADPEDVDTRIASYTGRAPRAALQAVLDRAHPAVARCARAGRATHVAVDLIATLGGEITIAEPSTQHPSDDEQVARCVGSAIRDAGPADFHGPLETAILTVEVTVPPG